MKLDLNAEDTRARMAQVLKRAQDWKLTQDEYFLLMYCETQSQDIRTLKNTIKVLQAQVFKRGHHGRQPQGEDTPKT
jgi:hypothetical protein